MNAESVKARLKNYAVSSGCTFQEALVYYGLERTIYRISVSPYRKGFSPSMNRTLSWAYQFKIISDLSI